MVLAPRTYPAAVAIGVCTFNRPAQLRRLLAAMNEVAAQVGPDRRVDVVVVDDGAASPVADVVAEAAGPFLGEMRYHFLGSADVATARNAALDICTSIAPWVVFIDDDCVPGPDWVTALFEVQERTGADVVTGHVQYTTAPVAPRWLREEPFCDFDVYADCDEPTFGTTANALIRSSFVCDHGIRFHHSFGQTGGEDMAFFHDVRSAGGRLRYAAKAVVIEELTPARQTLRYQLHRQLWLGNNMAEINRHTHQWSNLRLALRGGRWAVRGWRDFLRRAWQREPLQLRWTLALSLRGLGLMLGVAGVRVRHRA
jgi:succinoglycan biosynthesis protein ExoM